MVIDPNRAVREGWLTMSPYSKIQQSGIDVSVAKIRNLNSQSRDFYDGILLLSGQSYEFECHEYIKVPKDCIALVVVRSTFNRQGAFITTGLYDNGFSNFIGGVIHNMIRPIEIKANERIAQVVFYQCEHSAQYNGQYQVNLI